MAITISNIYPVTSGGYYPAYNDMVITASSNNTLQTNFKYVVDIYIQSTQVARLKYSPDVNGLLSSNVHRIVESYVSSDINVADVGFARCNNSINQITLKVGEEYGSTPTVYPNLASITVYITNTALDVMERKNYDDTNYLTDNNKIGRAHV